MESLPLVFAVFRFILGGVNHEGRSGSNKMQDRGYLCDGVQRGLSFPGREQKSHYHAEGDPLKASAEVQGRGEKVPQ